MKDAIIKDHSAGVGVAVIPGADSPLETIGFLSKHFEKRLRLRSCGWGIAVTVAGGGVGSSVGNRFRSGSGTGDQCESQKSTINFFINLFLCRDVIFANHSVSGPYNASPG
ncbi:MAG: hypothetical protein IPO36_14695 [Anaerolineales bacterium]|nr:hypothetical protein [Anaerolineales bacterium]